MAGPGSALTAVSKRVLPPELRSRLRYGHDLLRLWLAGPTPEILEGPIFVHVPKAAGSSILATGARSAKWHRPYRFYEAWAKRRGRPMPLSFAVVRDPYDRFLSAYSYLKAGGMNPIDAGWARRHLAGTADADAFARTLPNRPEIPRFMHFRPQVWFLRGADGQIGVNRVLRLETLAEDWAAFAREAGLTPGLPHRNASERRGGHAAALSAEGRAAIEAVYAEDFALLGYPRRGAA